MSNRLLSLVILISTAIAITWFSSTPVQQTPSKHAVLIGIDEYLYTTPLKGQKADVARMRQFLIDNKAFPSSQITELTDEQATRNNIEKTITGLQNSTLPNDSIFIYFAGHGFQVGDDNADETDDGMDEAIMPYDATTVSQSMFSSNKKERWAFKNMIRDDDFKVWLDALSDRKVEVLIDSCHSGTITRASGLTFGSEKTYQVKQPSTISNAKGQSYSVPTAPIELTSDGLRKSVELKPFIDPSVNRKVWTAASAMQLAYVDHLYSGPNVAGSVFTHYFIQGVAELEADTNADNHVTDTELLNYLRDQSKEYCSKNPGCIQLSPTLSTANQK